MAKLEDKVRAIRDRIVSSGGQPVPDTYQGVSKRRIRAVLTRLDLNHADIVDAVFALLDNQTSSWFGQAPSETTFADGATTAHVACHIGILQRDSSRLDREGRDYWIKPLGDIGAVEPVYLEAGGGRFLAGHPVAKSPNSAYRLNEEFVAVLRADGDESERLLGRWMADDAKRRRLALQAELGVKTKARVQTRHSDLIRACRDVYAPRFLPGFEVLFVARHIRLDRGGRLEALARGSIRFLSKAVAIVVAGQAGSTAPCGHYQATPPMWCCTRTEEVDARGVGQQELVG